MKKSILCVVAVALTTSLSSGAFAQEQIKPVAVTKSTQGALGGGLVSGPAIAAVLGLLLAAAALGGGSTSSTN